MPDRPHPIPFRPPAPVRARLEDYAQRTGRPVNAILTEAVRAYLDKRTTAARGSGARRHSA